MKLQKQHITLLTALTASSISLNAFSMTADEKITRLQQLVTDAQTQNIDVTREQMTLRMSELFLGWADWDEANQVSNAKFYAKHPLYKDDPSAHAVKLATFERNSVGAILDSAIAELTRAISGDITRKPVPNVDFNQVTIDNGEFRLNNNNSVFLSTYTWKPDDVLTNSYFGNLNNDFIAPAFITNEQGDTPQWRIDKIKNGNDPRIGQVFISHSNIPQWITNKYPDLTDDQRLFSKYLIDHPGAKELFSLFFAKYIPELKDKRSTALGYMLFNEPSFFTEAGKWNTGGVSDNAMVNFKLWLTDKHGSIAKLNTLWNTTYNSFNEINLVIPMTSNLKGTAIWYDWMRYNQVRVTKWFAFLDSEIKKYDTDAKTHIKLMPWLWNTSVRDHGMDFESLLEITDIVGFDANSEYLNHSNNTPDYKGEYSFDWQTPALSFDFFSSVQPNQVMWDSENHFFNKGKFQLKDVEPNYVRAVYWLVATHGLDGISTWMWGRNADGSNLEDTRGIHSEYITAVTHQPLGFHELTRTVMDINAHHSDIVRLQKANKAIRIFYSETSAIIQNDYMDSIRDVHKSLFFNGISLGFATQKIITNQTNNWGFIVVKDSQKITTAELASLKSYVDNGGTILVDSLSLKQNEYGDSHPTNLLPSGERVITYSSNIDLKTKTLALAKAKNILPEIKVEEVGNTSSNKVSWRVVKSDNNSYTLSLINLGETATTVAIDSVNNNFTVVIKNKITGVNENSSVALALRETKLFEVSLVNAEPTPESEPDTAPTPEPEPEPDSTPQPEAKSSSGGSIGFMGMLFTFLMLVRKKVK